MRRTTFKDYLGNKAFMRNKNNTCMSTSLVQNKQKYWCNITEAFQ